MLRWVIAVLIFAPVATSALAGEMKVPAPNMSSLVVVFQINDEVDVAEHMKILQDGHAVYAVEVGIPVRSLDDESLFPVPPGTLVTGDDRPDLVIQTFSGGAHCCFTYHVLELEPEIRPIVVFDTWDSTATFAKSETTGQTEIVLREMNFGYWNAPFVDSPAPTILLTFEGDKLILDMSAMRKSPPSGKQLTKDAAAVRKLIASDNEHSPHFPLPSQLWAAMLELIYTGNGNLALTFLDTAWPKDKPGKDKFLADFRAQLVKSHYWLGVAMLNNWSPQDPF